MKVQSPHRDRVYFHLGMGNRAGIPAGDLAEVEEALDTIVSDYMMTKLLQQLDRCDLAWDLSEMASGDGRYDTKEAYAGDIDRAIVRQSSKNHRVWWDNYLNESNLLAQLLWVPNYRNEDSIKYRFSRSGAEFINVLRGVADTSTASRRVEYKELAGSFGVM